jgi:hypothetical protein
MEIDPNLIWQAYRLHLKFGDDSAKIAENLNISEQQLTDLYQYEPFANAAQAAQADRLPACFESLSDESKETWRILSDNKSDADSKQRALMLLVNNGERERQKLLAFALMQNYFDVKGACNALKIPLKTYREWLKDPEFGDLIQEVQDAKRYLVESQLFRLVAHGSERATIFATERLLKDTYGQEVKHTGNIEHQHTHGSGLDLASLPIEVRSKIFEILQAHSSLIDPDGLLAESQPVIQAVEVKRIR